MHPESPEQMRYRPIREPAVKETIEDYGTSVRQATSMPLPSEDDFVDRLKIRDPHAMSELYDRYAVLVYSIVRRIIWDPADAEDVVQEVFLRIWNRAHLLDRSKGVLIAWLIAVTRSVAIDRLRAARGKAAQSTLNDPADGRLFDSEIVHLNRILVERALRDLDSSQRLIVELVYFEGLSQTEIAQRMDRPLGTVKTWIRGALIALRASLALDVAAPASRPVCMSNRLGSTSLPVNG